MGIIVKPAKTFEINANSRKAQKLRKLEHTKKLAEMQVMEYISKETENVSVGEIKQTVEIDSEIENALKNLNNL